MLACRASLPRACAGRALSTRSSVAAAARPTWVLKALSPKARSPASHTAESLGKGVTGLLAGALAPVEKINPFALPMPPSANHVTRVAERASRRKRETLADISLAKQESVLTGILTPGMVGESDGGKGRPQGAPARVTAEGLQRIQMAMTQRRSEAGRAVARAVLAAKAAELESREDEGAAGAITDVARAAFASGISIRLTSAEMGVAASSMMATLVPSMPRGQPAPIDKASTSLPTLSPEGKRLQAALADADGRSSLIDTAIDIVGLPQRRRGGGTWRA